ncbi:hypothetical protein P3T76_001562 [Phytophthora citrophthora]|uniref:RxLR effector protein n=1 Tax=Phytophthora citrophthora TaxID=4793 RepID=A0AAD9GZE2_9STRA|nr:hypothetical protein P3T76_001562 [Phytophthora citrophthora]
MRFTFLLVIMAVLATAVSASEDAKPSQIKNTYNLANGVSARRRLRVHKALDVNSEERVIPDVYHLSKWEKAALYPKIRAWRLRKLDVNAAMAELGVAAREVGTKKMAIIRLYNKIVMNGGLKHTPKGKYITQRK